MGNDMRTGTSRSTGWAVLVGFFLSSILMAQAPEAGTDPSAEPARIQGYVVRTGSGEPLSRAQVALRADPGSSRPAYAAVTDQGGRFSLANIRPGNYRLAVEREGYVDQEYGQVSPNRPGTLLVLSSGQQVQDVVIRMVPTGTITGRIYDQEGEPLVGADVRAMAFVYEQGERVLRVRGQAQTNDLGEYRLYWLDPGEYRVSARFQPGMREIRQLVEAIAAGAPQSGAALGLGGRGGRGAIDPGQIQNALNGLTDPGEETYVDHYFPGTLDARTASAVDVRPGSEIGGIDFAVLPARAVTISGEVVGPFSADASINASVLIVPKDSLAAAPRLGPGRGGNRGGPRGGADDAEFRLTGVVPGSYTLVALVRSGGFPAGRGGRGDRGPQMTGFIDLEVGNQDIDGLRISVQPGVTVQGRVLVDQSGDQIDVSRLSVRLEPLHALPIGTPNGQVEADGTFTIQNVSPTAHRVELRGLPPEAYLAGARVGSQDILDAGWVVRANAGPIEFYVGGAGTVLDGSVQLDPDQAFTGAQVVLIPENPGRRDLYKVSSVDQYGRFTMRGIAPGRYRVFAWEDAPSGAYADPAFVALYRDYGVGVVAEPGVQVHAQPRLIPSGL